MPLDTLSVCEPWHAAVIAQVPRAVAAGRVRVEPGTRDVGFEGNGLGELGVWWGEVDSCVMYWSGSTKFELAFQILCKVNFWGNK